MNKQGPNGIAYCDYTWSPVTGCLRGCSYCSARRIAERFGSKPCENSNCVVCGDCKLEPSFDCKRYIPSEKTHTLELPIRDFSKRTKDGRGIKEPFPYGFEPTFHPERLNEPLKVKRPSRILVSDMGDLLGEWVPSDWIESVLKTVRECPQHTFLFLTKNPVRYQQFEWSGNAWLGTPVENQAAADERIPQLIQVPVAVKFISVEPLLGKINIVPYIGHNAYKCKCGWHDTEQDLDLQLYAKGETVARCRNCGHFAEVYRAISWVIVGGQSGPNAHPVHPDWVRDLRDQSQAAGAPFFLKSMGEFIQVGECGNSSDDDKYYRKHNVERINHEGGMGYHGSGAIYMQRVGEKKSGRILDGQTWDEIPKMSS